MSTPARKPRRGKYFQVRDGDSWNEKNGYINKIVCCDCGLVHEFVLRVAGKRVGSNIGMSMRRHPRATAAMRRGQKVRSRVINLAAQFTRGARRRS